MCDAAQEQASERDMDHGVRHIDSFLIIAHEPSPSCHPTERALDDPAARENLEASRRVGSPDDLDDEVEKGRFVHQFCPVVGAISEQMFQPGPALAHRVEDQLSARAVGDVSCCQIQHEQASVGVDRDVALASDDLLTRIVAPRFRLGRLDGLAVDDPAGWARLTTLPFTIDHQRHVVNGVEHEAAYEAAKPPVDRLHGGNSFGNIRQPHPARAR